MRIGRLVLFSLVWSAAIFAQAPVITSGGVVNAASWSSPLAPGEIVAIFGMNLAADQQIASPPYPASLGGTSVTFNGIPAPVVFVSASQVNAQVPSSVTATASLTNTAAVVVKTAAGSSKAETVLMTSGMPGFFTADGSGCGQAAAANIKPDGTASLNSAANSASPGDYIALFGTGFGLAAGQPADGAVATAASPLAVTPRVFVDGNAVASLAYDGLAPSLAGVDQVNFQLPAAMRNGCAVPVSAAQTLGSPAVTISVQNGGGRCSDPPTQSWGSILLTLPGLPDSASAFLNASFPAGPNVSPPTPEKIVYAPDWMEGVYTMGFFFSAGPINIRTCQVPGYSSLSAGAIQIQPPVGDAFTLQPQTLGSGGVTYGGALPTGFGGPGSYAISGTPGNSVILNAKLKVGSPIQISTSLVSGTVISSSQPLTLQWTGGDAGSLVRVALSSLQPVPLGSMPGPTTYTYSYAKATDRSLTIRPACQGHGDVETPVTCSFGLPNSSNAQVSVEVLPDPAANPAISVPGVTGPVQLSWQYSYNFPGLVLGP